MQLQFVRAAYMTLYKQKKPQVGFFKKNPIERYAAAAAATTTAAADDGGRDRKRET